VFPKAFADEGRGDNELADDSAPKGGNITSLFSKLRSKYPELADEPLLDQVEAAAMGGEPTEDQSMDLPDEAAPELGAPDDGLDDTTPWGDGKGGVEGEAPAPKGKKRKFKAPPMPDLEAADESAPVNGGY
jgi:hypothetical protein